jgi:MFS family permease
LPVLAAEVLHGFASCMLGPAIAAISVMLVGPAGLGARLGRNARYGSVGNGLAAAAMGAVGTYISNQAVFLLTALLTLPALWALTLIHSRPEVGEAAVPVPTERSRGIADLLLDKRLLVFAACAMLFQLSNAALLQLLGGAETALNGADATLVIAACIVVPQLVVALFSPWVGRAADGLGRRPLLLLGFAVLPLRALIFAATASSWVIVPVQALDGVSGAVLGVMVPLVAADIAIGSGRFNLCLGAIGLAGGIGATLSTALAGWVADAHGQAAAFIGLAAVGVAGVLLVWLAMPETRPPATRPAIPERVREVSAPLSALGRSAASRPHSRRPRARAARNRRRE